MRGARRLRYITELDSTTLREVPPCGVIVLTDVTNPLLGEGGAAVVFGPQKGFATEELAEVDRALAHVAGMVNVDPRPLVLGRRGERALPCSRGARS